MKTILATAIAAFNIVKNKAFAFSVLIALMFAYSSIPPVRFDAAGNKTGGMPFADLLFVALLIAAVFAVTPVVRLLFFPEAAIYAEGKKLAPDEDPSAHNRSLEDDLAYGALTLKYQHYRLATIISFAVTLLIFATLGH